MIDLNAIIGMSAYWQVNKKIAIFLESNDTALLLADLISKSHYFEIREQLTPDGFFYYTMEDMQEATNLTRHVQDKCIKLLKKVGFISTKVKQMPARRFFKVNKEIIASFLLNNNSLPKNDKLDCGNSTNKIDEIHQTSLVNTDKPVCGNSTTNNNRDNNNKEDNKENKIKKFSLIDFRNFFLTRGADPQNLEDWIEVRKKKNASFTVTVCNAFEKKSETTSISIYEMIRACSENSWQGFEAEWYYNKYGKVQSSTSGVDGVNFNR